jgi:cell division protein FtsA
MKGAKIEVKTLFVTCLGQHLDELVQVIEDAGVEIEYVVAAPVAASLVALSRKQRTVGCVLVNIGAETVSMVVFEDDMPIFLHVFPIGSTDITNDIALGLQISLDEAEEIKRTGANIGGFSRRKLDDIIEARLSDILELIEADLKKIGRNGLLPAGVVLTGGGAGISTIEDLARATLRLPSIVPSGGDKSDPKNVHARQVKDSGWFVAYGLCVYGATQEIPVRRNVSVDAVTSKVKDWFNQLLP